MRTFFLIAIATIVMATLVTQVGCDRETSTRPIDRPDFLNSDGRLFHITDQGHIITGEVLGPNEVQFSITDGENEFGFRLGADSMLEWAVQDGNRDELMVEYGADDQLVVYTLNGIRHERRHADMPLWSMPKGMFGVDGPVSELPLGLPIDELEVFHNKLGFELTNSLEKLGAEIQPEGRILESDGNCSGTTMTFLAGCMKFKCPLGGVGNPACHACVGTFAACVIMAMISLFGGG